LLIKYTFYFTLFFCTTAFVSRYDQWLTLPPAAIHQWRQADGAAIAWHYAQDPDFWAVRQFNLFAVGDAHAVGELPLLYWFSGLITRYWGYPDYPLRWIGLALMIVGFWAFGWVILQLSKRPVIAALGAGLLSTSPILAYYGPNFLPDMPAFCMILVMSACLLRAEQSQRVSWIWAAAACAALGIMLKLSMAILPLALVLSWGLGRYRRQWSAASIWRTQWPSMAIALVFCAVAACRWWISQYNAAHQAQYFFADIRPIWRYDWLAIRDILKGIGSFGLPAYASAGLYLASLGSVYGWLKHRKSVAFIWQKTLLFASLGCFSYVLLWFRMLREHDYYAICLLILPGLLLPTGIGLAMRRYTEKTILYTLGICWFVGLWHCHYILNKRLEFAFHPPSTLNLPPEAFSAADQLTNVGIAPDAKILCPEDPSPNIALLALQRHGWTNYNFGDRITVDTLQRYQDRFGLEYLALRDTVRYAAVYRAFFPTRVGAVEGWYLYGR
jgi:hypothetical protein